MNTKHLANRFDTDGDFAPIYFINGQPEFKDVFIEFCCGMLGLCALISLIILVFAA